MGEGYEPMQIRSDIKQRAMALRVKVAEKDGVKRVGMTRVLEYLLDIEEGA